MRRHLAAAQQPARRRAGPDRPLCAGAAPARALPLLAAGETPLRATAGGAGRELPWQRGQLRPFKGSGRRELPWQRGPPRRLNGLRGFSNAFPPYFSDPPLSLTAGTRGAEALAAIAKRS